MWHSRFSLIILCAIGVCVVPVACAQQPAAYDAAAARAERHSTAEWLTVAAHLPDPKTATPSQLEMAGDVLRARRLPEDAIEYFQYAMDRGGDQVEMLNRIGVTELELGQPALARACFKRVVHLKARYAEGWNNLGATESMAGYTQAAIGDYLRAVKLNRRNAIFHANLGTAYFEAKDYESSRTQFNTAVKLDGDVFRRGGFGGSQVHILTADNRGRFAFEMARLAAGNHEEETMLHWLAVAAEGGFDVREGMNGLKEFDGYRKDARIALLLHNHEAMKAKQVAATEPLGPAPVQEQKFN